jgi:hypothetical protein
VIGIDALLDPLTGGPAYEHVTSNSGARSDDTRVAGGILADGTILVLVELGHLQAQIVHDAFHLRPPRLERSRNKLERSYVVIVFVADLILVGVLEVLKTMLEICEAPLLLGMVFHETRIQLIDDEPGRRIHRIVTFLETCVVWMRWEKI